MFRKLSGIMPAFISKGISPAPICQTKSYLYAPKLLSINEFKTRNRKSQNLWHHLAPRCRKGHPHGKKRLCQCFTTDTASFIC